MLEENSNRDVTHLLRAYYSSQKRCIAASFCLLQKHWLLTFVGALVFIYGSLPYLFLGTSYSLYGAHISKNLSPQIVISLVESATPAQAEILSKMAVAVARAEKVTVLTPEMTGEKISKSLGLPMNVAKQLNFALSIHIKFPSNSDPTILESLIRHLDTDSRVSAITSNIKNIGLFRELKRDTILFGIGSLFLISSGAFFISFYSANVYGRSYFREMTVLRLLGASDGELIKPLILCGLLNAFIFTAGSNFVALSLASEIDSIVSKFLVFFESPSNNHKDMVTTMLMYSSAPFISMISATFLSCLGALKNAKN